MGESGVNVSAAVAGDLELNEICALFRREDMGGEGLCPEELNGFLTNDPDEIRARQRAVRELMDDRALCSMLSCLLHWSRQAERLGAAADMPGNRGALASFADLATGFRAAVDEMHAHFSSRDVRSPLLMGLRDDVAAFRGSDAFDCLLQWSETCCAPEEAPRSLRLRVELDDAFLMRSVGIVDVSGHAYANTLSGCVYGKTGVRALERLNVFSGRVDRALSAMGTAQTEEPYGSTRLFDGYLEAQFLDMKRAIRAFLARYGAFVRERGRQLAFLLCCVAFADALSSFGLPCCFPEIAGREEGIFEADEAYSPLLAVRLGRAGEKGWQRRVVTNPVRFDRPNAALVVTGANQGGKTTYLQAIGLIQYLSQLGAMVPCARARVSPVDSIRSFFTGAEDRENQRSRLGQELKAAAALFEGLGEHALVLMNEPFTSTTAEDGLHFCRQALSLLVCAGVKSVWVTHLFELALPDRFDFLGDDARSIVSLVAEVDDGGGLPEPLYRVRRAPPGFKSYASAVFGREPPRA